MTNPLYDHLFAPHLGMATPFLLLPDQADWSHAHFLQTAAQFAHVLADSGMQPGDRLAVQALKSPQALALYAACVQAGIVFLPLNPTYTASEVAHFLADSEAHTLICDARHASPLAPVATKAGARLETLNADGSGSFAAQAHTKPTRFATVPRAADDLAALLYTSGTTGRAKGAMLTHANLLSNAQTLTRAWHFTKADILLHALPIFHTHGLFVATHVMLESGGAMIVLPKFDTDAVVANLPRATALMGVPTFYTRLLAHPHLTRQLCAHMRLFVSGSAPLSARTHAAFMGRTGHAILERYGMTETSMNSSNPYEGERRAGTVGFALPGVALRIADPASGLARAQGEVGQIEVRGPNVFAGYWRMPDRTAAEMRPDGFFMTGDLGRIDADGYLHVVGRIKDVILSGGYNIYPREIEALLDAQPGVRESAVIGVPHADLGEAVLGVIVPAAPDAADLEQIAQAAGLSLARFKQPRRLVLAESLPRNTMGKVEKTALRTTYEGIFAAP
ncbi:MAG: malonyl-CoA synthase [Rhodobacteraceae bacterium]|nr:malonyl-CoA synthase [Paracoccaceae bacterium]